MDEKSLDTGRFAQPTSFGHNGNNMSNARLPRSRRFLIGLLSLVLPFYIFVSLLSRFRNGTSPPVNHPSNASTLLRSDAPLVPLEAHIMSKCPDARDCLGDLVVPAMEEVVDMVNFTLSFIGSVDTNGSVHCKHGPGECLGDIIALCAGDLHPEDPIISLGFSNCLVSSYSEIPSLDLVEPCAIEHGLSFDDLNACISEYGKGLDLLQKSVERSQAAGVTKSCTVRLANKIWCIRDGGEWKECKHGSGVGSLVEEVKRVYGD